MREADPLLCRPPLISTPPSRVACPAPGLKKYKHLAGNYGGAWYRQKMDFTYFPGSILVTTNCVLDPMPSYRNK